MPLCGSWALHWQHVPEAVLQLVAVPGVVRAARSTTLGELRDELQQNSCMSVLTFMHTALSAAVQAADTQVFRVDCAAPLHRPCLPVCMKVNVSMHHPVTGALTGNLRTVIGAAGSRQKYAQLVLRTRINRGRWFSCSRVCCFLYRGYPLIPRCIMHHCCTAPGQQRNMCVQPHHLQWVTGSENCKLPPHVRNGRRVRAQLQAAHRPRIRGRFVAAGHNAAPAAAAAVRMPLFDLQTAAAHVQQAQVHGAVVQHVLAVSMQGY
jgi:hypothetical protein